MGDTECSLFGIYWKLYVPGGIHSIDYIEQSPFWSEQFNDIHVLTSFLNLIYPFQFLGNKNPRLFLGRFKSLCNSLKILIDL